MWEGAAVQHGQAARIVPDMRQNERHECFQFQKAVIDFSWHETSLQLETVRKIIWQKEKTKQSQQNHVCGTLRVS